MYRYSMQDRRHSLRSQGPVAPATHELTACNSAHGGYLKSVSKLVRMSRDIGCAPELAEFSAGKMHWVSICKPTLP
jgi:hypothetical protein